MYTKKSDIKKLEKELGAPVCTEMSYELDPNEFDMVESSMQFGRAHDVTLFIKNRDDGEKIAVIRKPFFPPGAYRAPSGAANPGESLVEGAKREAKEETGLDIEITRYLVRIGAKFTNGGRTINWTTHIFEARYISGDIGPIDKGEIAEAKWVTIDELQGPIRKVLLSSGVALFAYRVALTDLAVEVMRENKNKEMF